MLRSTDWRRTAAERRPLLDYFIEENKHMITPIKGHGEKFTRQKDAAIIGLMTQPTFEAAAKFAHIDSTTLARWLQDPAFQAQWQEARRQAMGRAMAQIQQASVAAVSTLTEIMADRKAAPSARCPTTKS